MANVKEAHMERKTETYISSEDICVCCGKPVPEGEQVCYNCRKSLEEEGEST